jgi:predicted RNase H-like HicB family nuclease
MMANYQAVVYREDGWWMVSIPEINGLTQARNLAEAPQMARELVTVTLDVPISDVNVDLVIEEVDGIPVRAIVDKVMADRNKAAELEADAAEKARDLATGLVKHGVSLRDIGAILGVSHQRVHQLVNA